MVPGGRRCAFWPGGQRVILGWNTGEHSVKMVHVRLYWLRPTRKLPLFKKKTKQQKQEQEQTQKDQPVLELFREKLDSVSKWMILIDVILINLPLICDWTAGDITFLKPQLAVCLNK